MFDELFLDNILLKYTLKSLIESFKYTLKSFLQKNIVHTFIISVYEIWEHLKRLEKLPKELGKLKINLKFLVRKKLENLVEILIYNL